MVKLQQAKDSCTGVGSNSNFESPPPPRKSSRA